MIKVGQNETKLTFTLTSLNAKNKAEYMKKFFFKNDEYHSYKLIKVYISDHFSNSVQKYLKRKEETDFTDVPPVGLKKEK